MRLNALILTAVLLTPSAPQASPVVRRLISHRDVRAACPVGSSLVIATTGGLVQRGPGGELTSLSDRVALPPGPMHALLSPRPNTIWAGGDGGLVLLHRRKDSWRAARRVAGPRQVRALARFRGDLFIGTWGGGLLRLKKGTDRPTAVDLGPVRTLRKVSSLAVAGDALFVGTAGGGVVRFDGASARRLSRRRLPSPVVWALAADGPRVWVATMGGLAQVRGGRIRSSRITRHAVGLPIQDLRSIRVESDGLLVGAFGGGLHRLTKRGLTRVSGVPKQSQVWAVSRTSAGLVVGTGDGVHAEQTGGRFLRSALPGPRSNDISAMALGQDGLWIGTFDSGISRYHNGRWTHLDRRQGLIDDRINHIVVQPVAGGEITWIATPRGVSRFDGRRWTRFPAGEDLARGHVNALHVAGARLYAASSGGVSVFHDGRWRIFATTRALPLRQVTTVTIDESGVLWAGGLDGIARHSGDRWTVLKAATRHLPDNWVTALLPAAGGGVWAGTYDAGLALLAPRPPRRQKIWREADGMPSGWVNPQALARTGSTLWIGTMEGGLVARTPAGWSRISTGAGLPSADVTAIVNAGTNRIWVATRGGAALIDIKEALR